MASSPNGAPEYKFCLNLNLPQALIRRFLLPRCRKLVWRTERSAGRRCRGRPSIGGLPVRGRLARFLVPSGNASGSWIRRRFAPVLIGLLEEVDETRVPCLATTDAGRVDAAAANALG